MAPCGFGTRVALQEPFRFRGGRRECRNYMAPQFSLLSFCPSCEKIWVRRATYPRRPLRGLVGAAEDFEFDAAVEGATVFGFVRGDGLGLAEAFRLQAARSDAFAEQVVAHG